jgi:sugar-specific transcriptional regulator TrmB
MSTRARVLARGFAWREAARWKMERDPLLDALNIDGDLMEVYRVLLVNGAQQPEMLAHLAEMPLERVRQAVAELLELTLIRPSLDRPGELIAVGPHLGLRLLMARAQEELARRQAWLEETRDQTAEIITEYGLEVPGGEASGLEVLHGMDEIRARLEAMAEECREEVMAIHPSSALPEEAIEAAKPVDQRAFRRGVKFRTIYLDPIAQDKPSLDYIAWGREQGASVRTRPVLPLRLVVVDRRVAIVANDSDRARGATVLYEPAVVHALCALFEIYWETAAPVDHPACTAHPHPDGLTSAHVRTLALLATGAKDDAIARMLHVSVRTERRIVAELMAALKASSRFEAGVKAARLGWI